MTNSLSLIVSSEAMGFSTEGSEGVYFSAPIMLGNRAQLWRMEFIISKIKKVLLAILLTITNAVCIIMFFLTVGKEAGGFIFETWMAIVSSINSTFFFGYTYVELVR